MTEIQRHRLPSFIIVGAQKSGTTSLFHYLASEDEIGMAAEKEVHFFDRFFQRGLGWYQSRFPPHASSSDRLLGEATPLYLFHPLAVQRIKDVLPDCRLVVSLRNPVDRAISHYYHEVALDHERRTFEEAIETEDEVISREYERVLEDGEYFSIDLQRYSYLARGRYFDQMTRLFDCFPSEQVLVLQAERLFTDPVEPLRKLHAFLGLAKPPRRSFPNEYGRRYAPISGATRTWLSDYYRPHNEKLFALLGIRFDW